MLNSSLQLFNEASIMKKALKSFINENAVSNYNRRKYTLKTLLSYI